MRTQFDPKRPCAVRTEARPVRQRNHYDFAAETILGYLKAFSSLNPSKHRAPLNAFLYLLAALTAYQLNPIKPVISFSPLLSLAA